MAGNSAQLCPAKPLVPPMKHYSALSKFSQINGRCNNQSRCCGALTAQSCMQGLR